MARLNEMYQVMVLYMLQQVEHPLTNTQITNFVLDKEYTTYFTIQQTLSDLLSSRLIRAESTHNNTRYSLTEEGAVTLHYFTDKISPEMKEDIRSYLQEHKMQLKEETRVYADYFKESGAGYQVRCRVKEGPRTVLELSLATPNEAQAQVICANWQSEYDEVYALLMDRLLK